MRICRILTNKSNPYQGEKQQQTRKAHLSRRPAWRYSSEVKDNYPAGRPLRRLPGTPSALRSGDRPVSSRLIQQDKLKQERNATQGSRANGPTSRRRNRGAGAPNDAGGGRAKVNLSPAPCVGDGDEEMKAPSEQHRRAGSGVLGAIDLIPANLTDADISCLRPTHFKSYMVIREHFSIKSTAP